MIQCAVLRIGTLTGGPLCRDSSDFFQHFGNGTSSSSIGKNCLILPSVGKIGDIYLQNGKNIMIRFSKNKQHMTGMHETWHYSMSQISD